MKKKTRNFLKGMGSVLDIAPSGRSLKAIKGTDRERLQGDWERIGQDMRTVISNMGPISAKDRSRDGARSRKESR